MQVIVVARSKLNQISPADYYVSTTGNDNNPGTEAQPFLTIGKALSVMSAGQLVYIRAGTYTESITTARSGTAGAYTRVFAYPGERVVLRPTAARVLNYDGVTASYMEFRDLALDGVNCTSDVVKFRLADCHHIRLRGCEIFNSNTQGILVTGTSTGHEIIKCDMHDNGVTHNLHHGIYIASHGCVIDGCLFHHNHANGIQLFDSSGSGVDDNIVRNNRVYSNGTTTQAAIILRSGLRNLAYNNIVYDSFDGLVAGTDGDEAEVYNNTIFNVTFNGLYIQCDNGFIRNNISYSCGTNLNQGGTGNTYSTNLTDGTDPLFVNQAGRDFHLQSGSPARNAGTTVSKVPDDFDGVTRPKGSAYDIGAYEFVE